jgi:formate hydrogenlyase subunit 7
VSRWIGLGLVTGVKTSRFPAAPDPEAAAPAAMAFEPTRLSAEEAVKAAALCPTSAIEVSGGRGQGELTFDAGQCVMCGRCARSFPQAFRLLHDPRVAVRSRERLRARVRWTAGGPPVPVEVAEAAAQLRDRSRRLFRRSLHIRHVDAGSCNGCESELQMLSTPYYDLHRLGLFFTPTPRHADALLVTGVVTEQMESALRDSYEAIPEPKLVVAAGVCAVGGGSFAGGPTTRGPLDRVLPVDVYVPGCPPTPLALLHGLLLAVGKAEERYRPLDAARAGRGGA